MSDHHFLFRLNFANVSMHIVHICIVFHSVVICTIPLNIAFLSSLCSHLHLVFDFWFRINLQLPVPSHAPLQQHAQLHVSTESLSTLCEWPTFLSLTAFWMHSHAYAVYPHVDSSCTSSFHFCFRLYFLVNFAPICTFCLFLDSAEIGSCASLCMLWLNSPHNCVQAWIFCLHCVNTLCFCVRLLFA